MSRVLFVYPNKDGCPIIPLGISVLSGILKRHGHEVALFDVTFMTPKYFDHEVRESSGVATPVDVRKYWGAGDNLDMEAEFRTLLRAFQPDVAAFSIVENNYLCATTLFRISKETTPALVLAGGLFPTTLPRLFIEDPNVDLICVGEGECALSELARRLDGKEDISTIANLIVKRGGRLIRNELARFHAWEPLTFQDWDIFDKRHVIKPFMGKMRRTGFFELSRGCPFNCTYCLNRLNQELFKGLGNYNREKAIEYAIQEIEDLKKQYALDLVLFSDENFLAIRKERLTEFCDKYRLRVGLPFFIMTRADSLLDEGKVKLLKDAGCVTVAIGVESGNETIRRQVLNKNLPNSVYERAFANCHKANMRTTANVMIGLPFETEADIVETAHFCRKVQARSLSLAIFVPYHGTHLRDLCIEHGFIEDRMYEEIAIIDQSTLTMPQLSQEKIRELYYRFNSLVYA
jgi:radical SAM superfamily enzyme YgiQ (UPF0313 family)